MEGRVSISPPPHGDTTTYYCRQRARQSGHYPDNYMKTRLHGMYSLLEPRPQLYKLMSADIVLAERTKTYSS